MNLQLSAILVTFCLFLCLLTTSKISPFSLILCNHPSAQPVQGFLPARIHSAPLISSALLCLHRLLWS